MSEAWAPSVSDVGALLRARTKDNNGVELGTFTSATRPTDIQVQTLIDQAVQDVIDLVGSGPIPTRLYRNAEMLATLGGAMLTELSYFPEQISRNMSAYTQYADQYKMRSQRLLQLFTADDVDVPGFENMLPAGSFSGQILPTAWWTQW